MERIDLKPYLDAVHKTEEDLNVIINHAKACLDGTEIGRAKADAMHPSLEAARRKVQRTNEVYLEMRQKASLINSGMRRKDFDLLDPVAQSGFIRQGGSLID